ncbi:MAG: YbhB/YbcL family Raf kinase inhibitor-like protein [Patescibacteria group bacterium]
MKLTSPAFENGEEIPAKYTCNGEDVSPPLTFSDISAEAKSLVLILDDPDAPAGVWDHWIIYDMPPDTREVPEAAEPCGVQGRGTSGSLGYQGPCPPDGEHRYFFKLYALGTVLRLPAGATKADVERAMEGHILEQAELMGRYAQ